MCGAEAAPLLAYRPVELFGCSSCGFAFQPYRSSADLRELYDASYFESFDLAERDTRADRAYEAAVRVRLVQDRVRQGRLLEIGAAAGYFVAAAAQVGFDARGVEPSAEIAIAGRRRFGVTILVGTAEEMAFDARSFDVACAWHVLEHIANPLPTLLSIREALRPGGYLFLEVPNFGSLRAKRDGAAWPSLQPLHHVAQYTPDALARLLARLEFVEVETVSVPFAVYRMGLRAVLSYGKHALILRGWPFSAHPWKHELLRAVARRPS